MNPCWLDKIVTWEDTAEQAEPVIFKVEIGGTEIYRGRLLCDDGYYSFNLAEIVRDSLAQTWPPCLGNGKAEYPDTLTAESAPAVRFAAAVYGWYESGAEESPDFTATPVFVYDWSFDEDGDAPGRLTTFVRTDPIDGVIHPLQHVILSAFDDLTVTVTQHGAGTVVSDFNNDFNIDFGGEGGDIVTFLSLGIRTNTVLLPGTWRPGRVTLEAGGHSVDLVVPSCLAARYVLHYVNAFGGWDSFVPRALCKQLDGLTRSEYTRRAVNVNSAGGWAPRRGRTVYNVAAARRWEMNTAWLSEAQAARMHHLLESPDVWLFDTVEARYIPVVITNSDCDYKTHAGEGRRLISYVLNIEEAIGRARR